MSVSNESDKVPLDTDAQASSAATTDSVTDNPASGADLAPESGTAPTSGQPDPEPGTDLVPDQPDPTPGAEPDPEQPAAPVRLAVFDLDGTCLDGQSGKLLSTWLLRHRYLTPRTASGLIWWGVRYKLHLPYRHELSRELIFRNFESYDPATVKKILLKFHDDVMSHRYRPDAIAEIARRKAEGCIVLIASATFDEVAQAAAKLLGADDSVATHMEVDFDGTFNGNVSGDVVAGPAKLEAVRSWANAHFGQGAWVLAYAYGDHHTDIELLEAAEHPAAVNPGPTLKRLARQNAWTILDWGSAPR